MLKPLTILLAALLIVLASPQAARADDAPADANAQKLKALFETFLNNQKALSEKSGGTKFDYDGAIMIEPVESYYAVTLPHIKVSYPDNSRVDIGMISINASPHEAGQWKMAVAIPTPMLVFDGKGGEPVKINIGAQKAAGIWDESLEGFAKLDALYSAISIDQPAAGYALKMPETQIRYDYNKNADGTWSGPGFFLARNIQIDWALAKSSLKLAELKGEFDLDRYNPAAVNEYKKHMLAADPSATTTEAKTQVLDQLTKLLTGLGGGFRSRFSLTGFSAAKPDPATGVRHSLSLQTGFAEISASDFLDDKANLGLKFGFDGLKTDPVPAGYEGVLPSTANFDFAFNKLPLRALVDLGKNTLEATLEQPEMTQLAGLSFMMKMPAILSTAGTGIEIKENHIGNDDYRFDLNGSARADVSAINFATGEFKGEFKGLDTLIGRVAAIAADPANPASGRAKNLGDSLAAMKSNGAVKPGTENTPVYLYDFVLNAQGQVLLNGKSLLEPALKAKSPPAPAP